MIVQVNFTVKWQFKEHNHYKITSCKKIINCQTGKIIKCTKNGGSVGYFIAKKFYKKATINDYIEKIPKLKKSDCPF